MLKPLAHTLTPCVILLTHISVNAAPNYNFEDFSSVLQAEYSKQLQENQKTQNLNTQRKQQQQRAIRARQAAQTATRKATVKPASRPQQPQHKIITNQGPSPLQPAGHNTSTSAASLFTAARSGNLHLIKQLLANGVDINSTNNDRETALHMATANGRYQTVIYLSNHGANLNSRTTKNWIPLHHAARFRHANIANYLKKLGSSPYARTSDGLNAIDMARATGDHNIVRILGGKP